MPDLFVRFKVRNRRHDRSDARLIVRTEERMPVRRDNRIALACRLCERFVRSRIERIRFRKFDESAVVVFMYDGIDVFSAHFVDRVHVRKKTKGRHVFKTLGSRQDAICIAKLGDVYVFQTRSLHLFGNHICKISLLRCRRHDPFVGFIRIAFGIRFYIAQKTLEQFFFFL